MLSVITSWLRFYFLLLESIFAQDVGRRSSSRMWIMDFDDAESSSKLASGTFTVISCIIH